MEQSWKQNCERVTPTRCTMNYREFIDSIYVLMQMVWGEEWGTFVMARPTHSDAENVSMPQITYNLLKRQPGVVGKEVREIKPRHRETVKGISTLTGEPTTINVKGQVMDCIVEFAVYAQNNKEALVWTDRFKDLMSTYKGILMEKGLQNMWYLEDTDRNENENLKDKVSSRKVVYQVRIEEVTHEEVETLKHINVQFKVAKNKLELDNALPSQQ